MTFNSVKAIYQQDLTKSHFIWQITSLIRTSPETFNGSLLMMDF